MNTQTLVECSNTFDCGWKGYIGECRFCFEDYWCPQCGYKAEIVEG